MTEGKSVREFKRGRKWFQNEAKKGMESGGIPLRKSN